MNNHNTIYSAHSIRYWPYYVPGMGLVCAFSLASIIGTVLIICIAVADGLVNNIDVILFLTISSCAFTVLIYPIWKIARTEICINRSGISVSGGLSYNNRTIQWDSVLNICYHEYRYYGLDFYIINYIGDDTEIVQTFTLPLHSIDNTELIKLFPQHLSVARY